MNLDEFDIYLKPDPESWELHDRIFSEDNMYGFVERAAELRDLSSTQVALPLMKTFHNGQTRKGKEHIPYINHPLLMACHAFALGVDEDNIIASILLHDVCEDCNVEPDELPFNSEIQEAVRCLTYKRKDGETKKEAHDRYYAAISKNRIATIVKVIDRCNNVSTMATAFDKNRIVRYINETYEYVMPLLDILKTGYDGKYYTVAFLLKYHMLSVLESDRHILKNIKGYQDIPDAHQ
jgi:GTP pyrophosphokinase